MRRLILMLLILQPLWAAAQVDDGMFAIMRFMGVTDLDQMDSYEVERLEELLNSPLQINMCSRQDMEKCGLFSQYQIASLVDYRSRHGDILSYTELSAMDGFGQAVALTLAPFLSLQTRQQVRADYKAFNQELALRSGFKSNGGYSYNYGGKYRLTSEKITLGLSASKPYDSSGHYPEYLSGNLSWNHSFGRLIIGDFNARFGQGLCLWNSAIFSGLSLPSAYMRKPTGFSPTNSFTGSSALTGLATDTQLGKWRLSAMMALPKVKQAANIGLMPALNVSRFGRFGQFSVSHVMEFTDVFTPAYRIPKMLSSTDAAMCIKGVNVFGEASFDWVDKTVACVCGTDFMASQRLRMAILLKYYPARGFTDDYGIASSGEVDFGRLKGNFSVEASYYPDPKSKTEDLCYQIKSQTEWTYKITDNILMEIRLKERFRSWGFRFKTDVRVGAQYKSDMITFSTRFNALTSDQLGLLGYIEGGYTPGWIAGYLRLGLFKVDDWDDRIYVYERDAPGNFNVPAFYGRGLWASAYLASKPERWLRLYLRASYISYIFMPIEIRKPGKAELKLQCLFRF